MYVSQSFPGYCGRTLLIYWERADWSGMRFVRPRGAGEQTHRIRVRPGFVSMIRVGMRGDLCETRNRTRTIGSRGLGYRVSGSCCRTERGWGLCGRG